MRHAEEIAALKEQVKANCTKIELVERMIQKEFLATDRAIETAKIELNRRLEGMNEFRAQLSKQATEFVGRTEITLLIKNLENEIRALGEIAAEKKGSSRWVDHIVTVTIAIGVVLIIHYVFKF